MKFRAIGATLALAFAVALSLAPAALAENETICDPAPAPGQCDEPYGAAVDFQTGRVYIADRAADRVNVYEADGTFVFSFGGTGSAAGQFDRPSFVAVDNDPASPAHQDIYVYDSGNRRLQKFHPDGEFVKAVGGFHDADERIAVGTGGTVYVADAINFNEKIELRRFDHALNANGACELANRVNGGLAVAPSGRIFLALNGSNHLIRELEWSEPECTQLGTVGPADVNTQALTIDAAGNLIAFQQAQLSRNGVVFVGVLTVFDPAGAIVTRFGYGNIAPDPASTTARGIATVDPLNDGTVVSFNGEFGTQPIVRRAFVSPPGPLVPILGIEVPPNSIASTKAQLSALIVPEGEATSYRFEYLDRGSYEGQGGFVGAATKAVEGEIDGSEADFALHPVEVLVGCPDPAVEIELPGNDCLQPETEYVFRVVASNASGNGDSPVEDPSFAFTTKAAPEIVETYASRVGTDAARLGTAVNPLGIPTTGYFQYVTEAEYQADLTLGGDGFAAAKMAPDVDGGQDPLDFGADEVPSRQEIVAAPLQPGTVYRFRLVASNSIPGPARMGPVKTVRSFAPARSDACPGNASFRTGASALLPDCRAYELVSPPEKQGGDIVVLHELSTNAPAVLNQSSISGEAVAYGSYRAFGDSKGSGFTAQYIAHRQAGVGWTSTGISPPRGRAIADPPSQLDTEVKLLSSDLCEVWIHTYAEPILAPGAVAGASNLYRQSLCPVGSYQAVTTVEPKHANVLGEYAQGLELQGVAAGGTQALYAAPDNLSAGIPPQPATCTPTATVNSCERRLYHQELGQPTPRYVCILPGGTPGGEPCSAGSALHGLANKYRNVSLKNAFSEDGRRIYWSELGAGPEGRLYLRVDGSKTTHVSKPIEDELGSNAAYSAWFWAATSDGSRALFSVGGSSRRLALFDAEKGSSDQIATRVSGVLGASEDLSRVYFVSRDGALDDGASDGAPNLFLYEEGEATARYHFVARLAEADALRDPTDTSPVAKVPFRHSGRVSPDGLNAAFVARTQPTGYDNTDAGSEAPCGSPEGICDSQVFVYDAAADQLRCASCNPSGGRPSGGSQLPPYENALYEGPRVLADDGSRVFFESQDSLVARDSNGRIDVYQWERLGTGSCDTANPAYTPSASGCIDLISSGQSVRDSQLLDASPTGGDVFFTTLAGLLPHDSDLVDVYDARVGGGLPAPTAVPVECEGAACQSPAAAPQDPAPTSSAFRGAGNFKPPRCNRRPAKRKAKRRAHRRGAPKRSRGTSGRSSTKRKPAAGKRAGKVKRGDAKARRPAKGKRNAKRCVAGKRRAGR